MHDLNDIVFFAAVAKHNGFTAAARVLRVPKSSVSRHVDRLETRLGVRLLERSTRKLRLTEAGKVYLSHCQTILADLETADRDVAQHQAEPTGIIRVSCPNGIAQYGLAQVIPSFMQRYPQVRVQILATNRLIDLIEDNIDVAIRVRNRLTDEALTMRKLGASRLIFVASPAFVASHVIPANPADLRDLPFLSMQEESERPSWTVIRKDGEPQVVTFDPALWTSDFNILVEAACAGAGVALLPIQVADRARRDGRLVRILPDWHSEAVTIHLIFMTKRGLAPAVRAFIDHVAVQLEPFWSEGT